MYFPILNLVNSTLAQATRPSKVPGIGAYSGSHTPFRYVEFVDTIFDP